MWLSWWCQHSERYIFQKVWALNLSWRTEMCWYELTCASSFFSMNSITHIFHMLQRVRSCSLGFCAHILSKKRLMDGMMTKFNWNKQAGDDRFEAWFCKVLQRFFDCGSLLGFRPSCQHLFSRLIFACRTNYFWLVIKCCWRTVEHRPSLKNYLSRAHTIKVSLSGLSPRPICLCLGVPARLVPSSALC